MESPEKKGNDNSIAMVMVAAVVVAIIVITILTITAIMAGPPAV